MIKSRLLVTAFLVLVPTIVFAANTGDVIFNEIAWMGTQISYNDEWIELYNNTNSSINLEGWTLKAMDGTPKINLTGIIQSNSFYLLERTNDETISDITADQIYTGALGNGGENLKIYDNLENLMDEINSSDGWLAGDNSTKQTMERKNSMASGNDSNNWGASQNPDGTPKAENSIAVKTSPAQPNLQAEPATPEGSEPRPESSGREPQSQSEPVPQSEPQPAVPEGSEPQPEDSGQELQTEPQQSPPPSSPLPEINNSSPAIISSGQENYLASPAPLSSVASNVSQEQQNLSINEETKSAEPSASLVRINQKNPQAGKIKQILILAGVAILAFFASIGLIFYRNSKF